MSKEPGKIKQCKQRSYKLQDTSQCMTTTPHFAYTSYSCILFVKLRRINIFMDSSNFHPTLSIKIVQNKNLSPKLLLRKEPNHCRHKRISNLHHWDKEKEPWRERSINIEITVLLNLPSWTGKCRIGSLTLLTNHNFLNAE